MKKTTLVLLFFIACTAIAYTIYRGSLKETPLVQTIAYVNETYGFSFEYPASYELSEKEVGNAEREHFSIVLTPRESLPLPEAGEGPTTISFDIYQNTLDKVSLFDWLANTNDSNFKLSNGTYATTTVMGVPAIRYAWSGLYEATTIAFELGGNIVAVTGTYISPADSIVSDFDRVVQSIQVK